MRNLLTCTLGLAAGSRTVSSVDIFVLINWTVGTNYTSFYWRYCFADYITTLLYHWLKHNLIHNDWNTIATPSDSKYKNGIKRIFEHCSRHNSQSPDGFFVICQYSSKDALNNKHMTHLYIHATTCEITAEWRQVDSDHWWKYSDTAVTQTTEYYEYLLETTDYHGSVYEYLLSCSNVLQTRKLLETMAGIKNLLKVAPRSYKFSSLLSP